MGADQSISFCFLLARVRTGLATRSLMLRVETCHKRPQWTRGKGVHRTIMTATSGHGHGDVLDTDGLCMARTGFHLKGVEDQSCFRLGSGQADDTIARRGRECKSRAWDLTGEKKESCLRRGFHSKLYAAQRGKASHGMDMCIDD